MIYRRVLAYYRPFLRPTVFALVLSLGGIGLNLLKPWPFKIIVDKCIPWRPVDADAHHFHGATFSIRRIRSLSRFQMVAVLCGALVVIQIVWER